MFALCFISKKREELKNVYVRHKSHCDFSLFPGLFFADICRERKIGKYTLRINLHESDFFIIEINLNNLMYFFNYHEKINVIAMKINNALTIKFHAMIT